MSKNDDKVMLSLQVSPVFREQLKLVALTEHRPLRDVVIDAVNEYMNKNAGAASAKVLGRLNHGGNSDAGK